MPYLNNFLIPTKIQIYPTKQESTYLRYNNSKNKKYLYIDNSLSIFAQICRQIHKTFFKHIYDLH